MTKRILTLALVGTLAFGPSVTHAAGQFAAPKGCTVYATVQQRNCQISQLYRCDGDAAGTQWTASLDGQGVFFVSQIDAETRWVQSIDPIAGTNEAIGEETDPASFSKLLESGRDDFDFTTVSSTGEVKRFKGFDQLTGEKFTIGGVTLERTNFALSAFAEDGSFLWRRQGKQMIDRDWRIFFSDTEDFDNAAGDKVSTVDAPVEFAFPGDKGFLSTEPKYDCDTVTADASRALTSKGALP